jgi:pimeloyl-ACP methyl ester carboxylesterase
MPIPSGASFSSCKDKGLAGFECGTVKAPLDYADPAKGDISVAFARARATDQPRGVLFVNPGGPGMPGRTFLKSALAMLSPEIKAVFDVIAVDPRGTGGTVGLDCDVNLDEVFGLDPSPTSGAEEAAIVNADVRFSAACEKASNGVLPYLSTAYSARDMDLVRAALGEDRINYLGLSYGTELGATYIALFPDRLGRIVLDGPIDVNLSPAERSILQGQGFEKALDGFLAWCEKEQCALHPRPAERFDALMTSLDERPLVNKGRTSTNLSVGLFATAVGMYSTDSYGYLGTALYRAENGDGSALLNLYDLYMERSPDGTYGTTQYGFRAISEADDEPLTLEEQSALLEKAKKTLPRLWPLFSTFPHENPWPSFARAEPVMFRAAPAGSTLVVAATEDPATPFAGGQALSKLLEAPLLVRVGGGHTSYGSSDCVRDAVDVFYLTGRTPSVSTECS